MQAVAACYTVRVEAGLYDDDPIADSIEFLQARTSVEVMAGSARGSPSECHLII